MMIKKLFMIFSSIFVLFAIVSCDSSPTDTSNTTEESTSGNTTQATTEIPTTVAPTTETPTTEELIFVPPTVEDGYLVDNPQDGLILHAWNWSLENIEAHLEEIAIAGFSSIQISPLQPQKDYFGDASWGSAWWKLYQPLGFEIAVSNHYIGTVVELESLTAAADAYGIKIIVDIVANHLAGGTSESLNADVEAFEPEIFQQNLIHTNNGLVSDTSVVATTKGALGEYPDLQTESDIVQQAVLDLLKDYVDAGVRGFRFDAAKHIETENDGEYSSDFWSTVINGINEYSTDDLYIYGEILNTPGSNRSYSDYTTYMGLTMNGMSDTVRSAVVLRDSGRLDNISNYGEVAANQTILWAESHDDYAAGHTDGINDTSITKSYVIHASRKDATTLYFSRPNEGTFMGQIGSYLWQSLEVSQINRFHNFFVGTNEYISIQNGFFINERYNETLEGFVIVDVDKSGSVNDLTVTNIPDGVYKDQISGNDFTVLSGEITGDMAENGIAVLYNNPNVSLPTVYVSNTGEQGSFTDTLTVTIYSHSAEEAYYSINGGEQVAFTGNVDVELSHPDLNAIVTLDIDVSSGDYHIQKTYEYVKSNEVIDEVTVNNLDDSFISPNYRIVAWTWKTGQDGEWAMGTYSNGTFVFDLPVGNDYFLLVLFPVATSSNNWNIKEFQTGDIAVPHDGIYDGSSLTWS